MHPTSRFCPPSTFKFSTITILELDEHLKMEWIGALSHPEGNPRK